MHQHDEQLLSSIALVVRDASHSLMKLEDSGIESEVQEPIARGYFEPSEQEVLREWFGKFLTARDVLHECIVDLRKVGTSDLRVFAVAYPAACALVRASRFLVVTVASERVVQRKLNETVDALRITHKQFTTIRKSLTSPKHAWLLFNAKSFASEQRQALRELKEDPVVGPAASLIPELESAIDVHPKDWLLGRIRYRIHGLRRRNKVALERAFFAIAELSGRVIADLKIGSKAKINRQVQKKLCDLLQPGDVVISRHDGAVSNYFLPGYWPHASLFVNDDLFLEARKDGVRLRTPDDTLSVDAAVILRPRLSNGQVQDAIAKAMIHEGKAYNFDFDFFNDERLVCTEVVYRAYQGVGDIEFELSYRAGRPSLSAEDILMLVKTDKFFDIVALLSERSTGGKLIEGEAALNALHAIDSH